MRSVWSVIRTAIQSINSPSKAWRTVRTSKSLLCLQEINDKARTKGEYNKIGEIYGFFIMVKTESTSKDLFDCSVNRFFVKGQESIYYTYNNGKLATDPKLACENFLGALGRIPKVIESHEKEKEKVVANKEIYTAIANGTWKKEDELRSLKG